MEKDRSFKLFSNTNRIRHMKKTRHEGDEGTVAFWLYMKALYKDEQQ